MSTTEIRSQVTAHLSTKTDAELVEMIALTDEVALQNWIADELVARHEVECIAALDAWEADWETTTETAIEVIIRAATK